MSLTDHGHLLRLQEILRARELDARIHPGSARGHRAQIHRRRVEDRTRQVAARGLRRFLARGWTRKQAATALGVSPRTLTDWTRRCPAVVPTRGRPARHADAETAHAVFALLQASGPGTGLPYLETQFPDLVRDELRDLRRIYQEQIFAQRQVLVQALNWQRPGAVWAMDFAHAPSLAEGDFLYLLVVRDLGSGRQLLVLPVVTQDTKPVLDALQALFLRHGPPLVMKSDNGAAFVSQETKEFLRIWKVEQLLSPPGLPSYNGSVEAGIGSLRIHAHYESARHGRSGEWTCDDVEAARQRCNLYGRPRGRRGPSPKSSGKLAPRSRPATVSASSWRAPWLAGAPLPSAGRVAAGRSRTSSSLQSSAKPSPSHSLATNTSWSGRSGYLSRLLASERGRFPDQHTPGLRDPLPP